MKILPYYQAIVDMVDHKIIGYEATIKGIRGKEEIGAVQLFEEAQYQDNTTQLDFEARKVSIENGLPFLQYQERLFLNMVPDSLYLPDSWFPVQTPVHQVTLEITEQAPVLANNELIRNLEKLRAKGMKLALDDFGRGYHNLLLIDLLQPDYLKIDRSITTESTSRVMRWILSLCQDTKTEVIAEGVETREQLDRLLQLGVRYFQGYLFGPPTPLPFLEKHNPLSNTYKEDFR